MKKFLTLSMMALAVVLASSCNKTEEVTDPLYVNTWVAEDLTIDDIYSNGDGSSAIYGLPEDYATELQNMRFKVIMKIDGDGNGNLGLYVDQATLAFVQKLIVWANKEDLGIPAEALQYVAKIKANDYAGLSLTYTVAPTDETQGKITILSNLGEGSEPAVLSYSELSKDSVKLGVNFEEDSETTDRPLAGQVVEPVVINFKSLSSTGIKLGKFVDIAPALLLFFNREV